LWLQLFLRKLVDIHFADLSVIPGIKPFRHTEDDLLASIGQHEHLPGRPVEIDAFDLSYPSELCENLFVSDIGV